VRRCMGTLAKHNVEHGTCNVQCGTSTPKAATGGGKRAAALTFNALDIGHCHIKRSHSQFAWPRTTPPGELVWLCDCAQVTLCGVRECAVRCAW